MKSNEEKEFSLNIKLKEEYIIFNCLEYENPLKKFKNKLTLEDFKEIFILKIVIV